MANKDVWAAYQSMMGTIGEETANSEELPIPAYSNDTIVVQLDMDEEIDQKVDEMLDHNEDMNEKLRTQHEVPLESLQIDDIPDEVCQIETTYIGSIHHYMGEFSVCEAEKAVDINTLILNKDGQPIARVVDVFGQTDRPQLIIKRKDDQLLPIQTPLYVAVNSSFPDPDTIQKLYPGCDASNKFDEPEITDFSDDEEEKEKKKAKHEKKRGKDKPLQPSAAPAMTFGYNRD